MQLYEHFRKCIRLPETVREMALIVAFLFNLLVVYTLQMQGSSAVTDVFVKTGDDLILNLTAEIPSNSQFWLWQFKDDALVQFPRGSQPNIVNNRFGKVEVIEKNYSVKLKDVQKSHSGIYTAKVVSPKEQILTQYNVAVQDPVSAVDLNFTCSSSSSSYNLTATCRTDNISITLRCDYLFCNKEEAERNLVTKSGSSLHIYKLKESVVCNHSNQVSKVESKENIENRCPPPRKPRKYYWYIILILLVLLTCLIYIGYRKCKKGDKGNFDNTIYALPVVNDQTETLNKTDEDEACSPTTTYSVVGISTSKAATKTRDNDQPQSVYSLIKAV
ncbi:uncharacterized protein LOC111608939 isoform X2 [Xiphophorus maculatus]|uniref:uncharacterized protein LOC111608939 isoform X2 n=1 Tax=Xiphophorus maculatus TaxID=8083 RepID=UPI000C6ED97B|nr:uncharacterized protein LOC111608939 isoform X2 [Xiphophorus maculatus]